MVQLPALIDVVNDSNINTVNWFLMVENPNEEFFTKTGEEVAAALQAGISNSVTAGEAEFTKAYRSILIQLFLDLKRLKDTDALYMFREVLPMRFFHIDANPGILISPIGLGIHLNEFALDQRERVTLVLREYIVPEALTLYQHLGGMDLGFMGLDVTYGVSDFTSDLDLAAGETIIIVFPIGPLRQFTQGLITDAELVESSFVFVGGLGTDLRRTSISLY